MAWFGFWIFITIVFVTDCYFYNQGFDTFFQRHSTPDEKEIQRMKLDKLKQELKRKVKND